MKLSASPSTFEPLSVIAMRGAASSDPDADVGQTTEACFLDVVEFGQRVVDILALLAQLLPLLVDTLHQKFKLADLARRFLVDLDYLADLGNREANATSAQDLADEPSIGLAEKPRASASLGVDQPLVLVEAKRSGRNSEFTRQLRYAKILAHCPIVLEVLQRCPPDRQQQYESAWQFSLCARTIIILTFT